MCSKEVFEITAPVSQPATEVYDIDIKKIKT
jgi:hypothetical protein